MISKEGHATWRLQHQDIETNIIMQKWEILLIFAWIFERQNEREQNLFPLFITYLIDIAVWN